MMRKNILLLLATLLSIQIASAQKLPSTLLWRISGKGLQNPSYLYGTMHLTDERIFYMGDSLYSALEKSDGFATEIDPSEFTSLIIGEAKKSVKNQLLIRDLLSKEKFDKYGKLLAGKLHKDQNEITTNDIRDEKNKWMNESLKNGKMRTFLDMYLYDIARRKGKWTSGIEDPQDQADLEDRVDETDIEHIALYKNYDEFSKMQDKEGDFFINSYIDNDLNIIDSITNLSDSLSNDIILVRRNLKMALRIDSMSKVRPTLFAIGAAHLPGRKGLIALLREKGYSVTPVFSSKKIKPSDYKVKEMAIRWYDVKDEDSLYTASMPGMAGDMNWYGFMKMKLFYDAFSSTVYMTSAMNTPFTQHMGDSIFHDLAKEFFGADQSLKGKPIKVNNIPGFEYISTSENYSHGYLLFKDGKMYMALARSMKEDTSATKDINRFLHSFSINEPKVSQEKDFHYVNQLKAYQLALTSAPQSAAELVITKDNSITTDIYYSIDPGSGAYLLFGTNESAPGYFIQNDSIILGNLKQNQSAKVEKYLIDSSFIKDGFRTMVLQGLMHGNNLMMKVEYIFRGNRWYALVAMYDSSKNQSAIDHFFNSFSTIEYAKSRWGTYAPDDTLFHTWAPANFSAEEKVEGEDTKSSYHSYDSTRGDSYTMVLGKLNKYLWYNDDSTFWELMIDRKNVTDSLWSKKKIQNGSAIGYEYAIQEQGSSNVKRVRMLLDGDRMFTLITIQSGTEIYNDNNNKFFDSFRIDKNSASPGLFVSKAEILLNDIASQDSGISNTAREHLSGAAFTENNLPLLQKALLLHYTEGSNLDNEQVKMQLSRIIINLEDSSSFNFAKNNYPGADDTTRNALLNIMASFPTQENFNDLKNILITNTPRIAPGDYFSAIFADSIELAASVLPELLPLIKDTIMAPSIIAITKLMADSGLINKTQLIPYEADLLQLSELYYNNLEKNIDEYLYVNYNLQELIAKFNTSASNDMLQRWSEGSHNYLKYYAVLYLLENKQPIKANAVNALAENKYTRISLYDTLKSYKKLALFPAKYATQNAFAESLAFSADDDYDVNKVIFLSEKIIEFEGKKSKFYFFKLGYGEAGDNQYILAGAGPFSLNSKDLSTKEAYGTIYYEEDFDESKPGEQMDALIQQMKENAKYRRENAEAD